MTARPGSWQRVAGRWRRLPTPARDALPAGVLWLCAALLPLLDSSTRAAEPTLAAVAVHLGFTTLLCAPLLVRRRFPVLTAVAVGAVMIMALALRIPLFHGGLPMIVAFIAAASASYYRTGWWRLLLAVMIAGATAAAGLLGGQTPTATDLFLLVSSTLLPITLGWVLRLQRDRTRELIRLREAAHRQARAEDHTRIAREVHDSVGHHLSSIRLRAVGALADRTTPTDEPLQAIADTSAQALAEIRRLLDLLRADEPAPPVPLADLNALARDAGEPPHRTVTVAIGPDVPATVPHDAYRIVQESVTNAIRHASARSIRVGLEHDTGSLIITVDDDGTARPGTPTTAGFGLPGMAQRVHRAGGSFVAGPREPHGWSVRAALPLLPSSVADS
ncbi:sensor histidine kinase [Microlunatus sp. GCM10028923]|uniref:sensor histidine kinase n=1 Tax=Microlunatus sp. GCM10028923 TaxID=3273400 RepID=UPI00360D43DD